MTTYFECCVLDNTYTYLSSHSSSLYIPSISRDTQWSSLPQSSRKGIILGYCICIRDMINQCTHSISMLSLWRSAHTSYTRCTHDTMHTRCTHDAHTMHTHDAHTWCTHDATRCTHDAHTMHTRVVTLYTLIRLLHVFRSGVWFMCWHQCASSMHFKHFKHFDNDGFPMTY
jgi:hypothetical protein